jgi:glycosyltransferase involved in cell wall biosynthesis
MHRARLDARPGRLEAMRVIVAGQNYRIVGGSDRALMQHCDLLSANGVEVAPFCAAHKDNLPSDWSGFFPADVNFASPSPADLARYVYSQQSRRLLSDLISEFKPDLLHLHIYYGKLSGSIFASARDAGVPVIQTLHEFKIVCPIHSLSRHGSSCRACAGFNFRHALINRCNRGSLARSALTWLESSVTHMAGGLDSVNKFIAVSDFVRNTVVEMGVPSDKVAVVPNFTDYEAVTPNFGHDNYFLCYGRLEAGKGLLPLLEAFRALPSLRLVVAGAGSQAGELARYVTANQMSNVEFRGFCSGPELSSLIGGATAIVCPSLAAETFGLTIIEAFAHGKPVIASRIGAFPEVVSDGESGTLVPPGDVAALVEAIQHLASDELGRRFMALAARDRVVNHFGPDTHMASLRAVYDSVLAA